MQSTNPYINTIDIQAKEWFDRINGNSYFSGQVTLDYGQETEKTFYMPFQYGYGDAYLHHAFDTLLKEGYIADSKPFQRLIAYAREHHIPLRYSKHERCLKREVENFGEQ
jgi:hypothetical protein